MIIPITYFTKTSLSKLKIDDLYVKFKMSLNCDEALQHILYLHNIDSSLNGSMMEALLRYAYGDIIECKADKIFTNMNKPPTVEEFIIMSSDSKLHAFIKEFLFGEETEKVKILKHCILYINFIHGDPLSEMSDSSVDKYYRYLYDHIDIIMKYMYDIKDYLNLKNTPTFEACCDGYKIQGLIGYPDMICDDWIIEIKCSSESNISYWHKQLEVYNIKVRKEKIGIINIKTNTFIEFLNKDLINEDMLLDFY